MLVLLLCMIPLVSAQLGRTQHNRRNVGPLITQCFYEGRWFPSGTIISAGRSVNWCYGSYCDLDGTVQHWDDYNCPSPSGGNSQPPFPNVLQPNRPTTTTPAPPTRAPTFYYPTTTMSSFDNMGCLYEGQFYWPGQDIFNKRRGRRCIGAYCDWNSNVQHWQDDCRFAMPPTTRPTPRPFAQRTAPTPVET